MEAEMGIETISSMGEIKIEGVSINQSAKSTFVAKAGATAEMSAAAVTIKGDAQATLQGGANTTIKGTIVTIN